MTSTRKPLWILFVLLVLSLCGNLVLGGVLVGRDLAHGSPGRTGGERAAPFGDLRGAAQLVPPEARPHLRAVLDERRAEMRDALRAQRRAQKTYAAALAAGAGPEETGRLAAQLRAATARTQEALHDAVAEALARARSAKER